MLKKWGIPGAIVGFFLAFQLYVIYTGSYSVHGDNSLYMYMARQLSRGVIPYRDFFFAHPPLMIAPTALLIKLFGTPFTVGTIQPIIGGAASVFLTYLIAEKIRKGSGIYAASLLATAHHLLFFSHWLGGVSLALAFLLLSFYLSLEKRHGLAGVAFVLSLLVRISHFPAVVVFLGYHIYKKNWKFFRGFGIAAALSLPLLLIPNFLQDVVLYHFVKKASVLSVGYGAFWSIIRNQWAPIALSALSLGFFAREKKKSLPLMVSYLVSASCVLLFALSEVRVWYVLYIVPFLCILGGYFLKEASEFKINRKSIEPAVIGVFIVLLALSLQPAWATTSYSEQESFDPVYNLLEINRGDYLFDTLSGMGPYLALKNDADISGNLIDMNPMRFAGGLVDGKEVVSRLSEEPPKYIIDARGGTGEEVSWDHYWRKTEVRDYVYGNYAPHFMVYNGDLFTLTLIWEKQKDAPIPEFEPGQGVYEISFLDMHEIVEKRVDTHYLTGKRLSNKTDFELGSFVDGLQKISLEGRRVVAHGAWDFSKPHNVVLDGDLRSETWITPHGGNFIVVTETSEGGTTISILAMELDPEAGVWNSLIIYENKVGGLVPSYRRRLSQGS